MTTPARAATAAVIGVLVVGGAFARRPVNRRRRARPIADPGGIAAAHRPDPPAPSIADRAARWPLAARTYVSTRFAPDTPTPPA